MSQVGFVVFVGGAILFSLVYLWRRERSRAGLWWVASWLALYASALVIARSDPTTLDYAVGSVLGCLFSGGLLAGALAYAGRPVAPGLLAAVVALSLASGLAHLLLGSEVAYLLILPLEVPLLLAAAWIAWRATRQRSAIERALPAVLAAVAVLDSVDAVVRSQNASDDFLVAGWMGVMLVLVMVQVAALVERTLERERNLADELHQARRLETLGRLAGGVAHDFNNQLTVILACAEILHDRLGDDAKARGTLRELTGAAEHSAGITQDLLAFGRQTQLRPQRVSATAALRAVESELRGQLPPDVKLEVRCDPALPPLLADGTQLRRSLSNLAVNALDAVGESGAILIVLRRPEPGRSLPPPSLEGATCWLEIVVQDDGIGMDADTRSHIFDPFFTTKAPGHGTGLGLGIVYGCLRAHGGHIEVESKPDGGTRFALLWPADETGPAAPGPSRAPDDPRGSETVLLAEDEASIRRLASNALKARGYRVIEAEDGQAGVDLFRSRRADVDVVVFDLAMPRRSGPEALRELREIDPQLPAILITGQPGQGLDAEIPGGVPLLQKPFAPDTLALHIRELLDERSSKSRSG